MSKTKQFEIEVGQDLKDALKEYFDLADDRIMSAARQIKNLANTIKTILITSKASESKLVINKEQIDIIEPLKLGRP